MTDSKTAFEQLSAQHKKFVLLYLGECCFNATKAYTGAGYSKNGARQSAHRLLTNADVSAAVSELLHTHGITSERVEVALAEIAFGGDMADLEDFLLAGKTLKDLRAAGFDTKLIKALRIRREAGGTKEKPVVYEHVTIDLHDRQAALRELVRVLGLVTEKRQVEFPGADLRNLTEQELLARAHVTKAEDGS